MLNDDHRVNIDTRLSHKFLSYKFVCIVISSCKEKKNRIDCRDIILLYRILPSERTDQIFTRLFNQILVGVGR